MASNPAIAFRLQSWRPAGRVAEFGRLLALLMKCAPAIKFAKPRQNFQVGKHSAVLFGDIEPAGSVQYHYILAVFDEKRQPCYFVASEVNSMAKSFGGGSHFLGLFDGEGHANCGDSDDWADEAKFTAEALRIVREKFEVQT